MTLHFVYARGIRTSAPHSITQELLPRLRAATPPFGDVILHDLADLRTLTPSSNGNDILLGHPHPDPRTIFAASLRHPGWKRRIVLCPYSHALLELNGWMDDLIEHADTFLAITGKYWFDSMGDSALSHWRYKTRRLDLAVNPQWFPAVKRAWNPPGQRRFLYIGYAAPAKGTDYLAALADANPDLHFGWIGGAGPIPSSSAIEMHGPCDFNLTESLRLIASYDFLISCGRSDANPTTILEALAWGLVPVCTPQSGYQNEKWLVNIPLDDLPIASALLHELNHAPESELSAAISAGRAELSTHYTWDRFGDDVIRTLRELRPARPSDAHWQATAAANRDRLRDFFKTRGGQP